MKYKLTVRKPEKRENTTENCYQAETDEGTFTLHLNALVEDIESNKMVSNASEAGNVITIESNLTAKDLQGSLEGLFKREFCFIRFEKIEQIT